MGEKYPEEDEASLQGSPFSGTESDDEMGGGTGSEGRALCPDVISSD